MDRPRPARRGGPWPPLLILVVAIAGIPPAAVLAFGGDGARAPARPHQSTQAGAARATDSLPPPLRLAFYYAWFPETWRRPGGGAPFTRYRPSLGLYRSSATNVIRRHVAAMRYARIDGALVSWWGRGSSSDARLARLLRRPSGPRFRWAIYYEPEGQGDPSPTRIRADLRHIRARHASQRDFLRIGGRFVVSVYGDAGDGCAMARRWRAGRIRSAYVVLKVFPGYRSCAARPDGWHQYAPAIPRDEQPGFSVSISPGFFHAGEDAPRLGRNLGRWRRNVARMVRSRAPFQLITTFNEWGEGTAVESSRSWASPSGYGDYLDVLHANPTLGVWSRAPAPAALRPGAVPGSARP